MYAIQSARRRANRAGCRKADRTLRRARTRGGESRRGPNTESDNRSPSSRRSSAMSARRSESFVHTLAPAPRAKAQHEAPDDGGEENARSGRREDVEAEHRRLGL